jgi:hypothetical protein
VLLVSRREREEAAPSALDEHERFNAADDRPGAAGSARAGPSEGRHAGTVVRRVSVPRLWPFRDGAAAFPFDPGRLWVLSREHKCRTRLEVCMTLQLHWNSGVHIMDVIRPCGE